MRTFVVVGVSLTLIACAQSPDRIASTQVSDETYQTYTCEHLEAEQAQTEQALAQASQQQNQARNNDIAGLIFLGLPVGSMLGQDVAPVIAQYRGQLDAMRRASISRSCVTQWIGAQGR